MDEKTQTGQEIKPVNDTQEVAVPTTEQKTSEPVVEQQVTESGLPNEASERTKHEFEKLQTQLHEERRRREAVENAFKSMQPAKTETVAPLYDENGYLNEQALTDVQQRAIAAEKRAAAAEQSIKGYMEYQEKARVYEAYPELNPEGKTHDKEFHKETRRIALDSMLNPDDYGGKQLSFKEAADLAKGKLTKGIDAVKKEAAQEAIEQLTPKEQAALEAVGTPGRRDVIAGERLDDLRTRSRRGDETAIMERLARLRKQG